MASSPPRTFCERFATDPFVVSSEREFMDAARDAQTISFIDDAAVAVLDDLAFQYGDDDVPPPEWRRLIASVSLGPVILITSDSPLTTMTGLRSRPWLSHVLSASMLEHPMAEAHLGRVIEAAASQRAPKLTNWFGPDVSGRRVRLTHASRRIDRLARMSDYVASKGASPRAVQQLRDAADELIVNAFYDAPVAAGAVDRRIPRNQDVSLAEECACDLAYGCDGDLVFVSVRDPFGSLSRTMLIEALAGGTNTEGLRRVIAQASVIAISVVGNRNTEMLVGFLDGAPATSQYALHLFFEGSARRRLWKSASQDTGGTEATLQSTFVSLVLDDDHK